MTALTLYGFPQSTYVRTARMACEEKGVAYTLESADFKGEAYRKLHPFAKVPALRHGDLVLFETEAIIRYVDEAFPGPALQPAEAAERARMAQWLSAIGSYVYPTMIGKIVIERFAPNIFNRATDEAVIKSAVPDLAYQLGVLEQALAHSPWLAGPSLSLADLLLAPILFYVGMVPEGQKALPGHKALARWNEAMASRASFKATVPQLG
ncbi:MAG: glutathione S-transferase family protein [Alphaproteobacteria bacterium]